MGRFALEQPREINPPGEQGQDAGRPAPDSHVGAGTFHPEIRWELAEKPAEGWIWPAEQMWATLTIPP